MLEIIFVFVVIIHGTFHLLGFLKRFDLVNVKFFTGKTSIPISKTFSRVVDIFWLIAAVLFVAAAVIFLLKCEWWWMVAAFAITISQLLIIIYWQDARYGTIANLIIFLISLVAFGYWHFNKMTLKEINMLYSSNNFINKTASIEDAQKLPAVIQKWLKRSGALNKEYIRAVYLTQKGEMKLKPNGDWRRFEAEQYFNALTPSFVWKTNLDFSSVINVVGRDKYFNGKGNMLIKLLAIFPIANSSSEQIDRGTAIRYLAEMSWFPTAALSNYITWEEIDSTTAKATINYGGITESGIFSFNNDGDFKSFEAMRYYDRMEGATLEKWHIQVMQNGYKEFYGVKIPVKLAVTWKLKSGDFTWLNLEITDIKYNEPQLCE